MKKQFLIFALILFSLTFVSSSPPVTTVQQFPEGYIVSEIEHSYLKVNQDYRYSIYVYNSSNGIAMNNNTITCRFILANDSGINLFASDMEFQSAGFWAIDIKGTNFSKVGLYPYRVNCKDGLGGTLKGAFEVTPSGRGDTNNTIFYILILALGYLINLIGFFKRNATITILGGIILIFVGLFLIQNGLIIFMEGITLAISYVTLFWGGGSAVWAAIETIQENL